MIRSGFALLLAAGAAASASAADAAKCDRQIVMQVDAAWVAPASGGYQVDAFGVSESAGWSKPTLVVVGKGENGTVHVDFVACRPEVSAQVLTPIQTRVNLNLDPATTRRIVIRAKTNSMTVEISK